MRYSVALSASLLVACFGKGGGYAVVTEANPNPFRVRGCKLTVDAVAFDRLVYSGQPEAQRVANMAPDQQATFNGDKTAFSFAFKQELVASRPNLIADAPSGGEGSFLMRPALLRYTPSGDAEISISVTDASGQRVLDEIHVTATVTDLRGAASPLAKGVNRYLKSRFVCSR